MRKFEGLGWDGRAVVLAKRLIPDDPPSWLDPPKTEKHWIMLWACIGQELAEKEPEFTWGRGRHPGSRNKKLAPTTNAGTLYKRKARDKERAPEPGND
jgi:hypothetical protein